MEFRLSSGSALGLVLAMAFTNCSESELTQTPAPSIPWQHTVHYCAGTAPSISALDVMLAVDTTNSMFGTIENMQRNLGELTDAIVEMEPRTRIGVSHFDDFPNYGGYLGFDTPYELLQPLTRDMNLVADGLAALTTPYGLPTGAGGDVEETYIEAIYQAITGEGLDVEGDNDYTGPDDVYPSQPGWEESPGARRVVVLVGDAAFRDPDDGDPAPSNAHGQIQATTVALNAGVHVVGLAVQGGPRPEMNEMANATGAISLDGYDANGDGDFQDAGEIAPGGPLVFSIDRDGNPVWGGGENIGDVIVEALRQVLTKNMWVEIEGPGAEVLAPRMRVEPERFDNVKLGEEFCFDVSFSGEYLEGNKPLYDVTLNIMSDFGLLIRSEDIQVPPPVQGQQ